MNDYISRQLAIDAVEFGITYAKAFDVNTGESKELFKEGNDALKKAVERLKALPSAQPEPLMLRVNHELTKEEYDKLMHDIKDAPIVLLPSAQPEIIRCKDCLMHGVCRFEQGLGLDGYCSQAERRTDD